MTTSSGFGQSLMASLAMLVLVVPGWAEPVRVGGIVISDPQITVSATDRTQAVGTLILHNETGETEALVGIRSDVPTLTLRHNVEIADQMRLVPVNRLAMPRGGTITFTPEALHLFLDGTAFEAGESVRVTFVFQDAGEIQVDFPISAP